MNELSVGISANGRYFTDRNADPLYWLGDTQWNLFRCHTREEAGVILENRRKKGFTVIQVMLPGFRNQVEAAAICGEAFPDNDLSAPNSAYFDHVNDIIELAWQYGIVLAIGIDHPAYKLSNMDNARKYGHWLGERYRSFPNIIWVASYYIPEGEALQITRELAWGLHEGDHGMHRITCHPDPAQPVATSGVCHDESWLDFNCIQTFNSVDLIFSSVIEDYHRIPAKPVVMAEGAYENGPEYGFAITPRIIRKQAYLSCFAGGFHSYGHNDNWRVPATWQTSLDSPGARQMTVLKNIFTSTRWWELQTDQTLVGSDESADIPVKALRSPAGDFLMIYSGSTTPFTVKMNQFKSYGPVTGTWINPENGETIQVEPFTLHGSHAFQSPSGWEDSILILNKTPSQAPAFSPIPGWPE